MNFNTVYEIALFSIGDTKSGTKMGKLQLKDTNSDEVLNCILWEETLNKYDGKAFRTGNHVKLITATYNEKFNNCLVSVFEVVKEAKAGLDKAEQDVYFSKILGYIEKINDEKLKTFLRDYFETHESPIKITPAAKHMHHNYVGGLLVHTLECLQIADGIIDTLVQKPSSDEVYAACILHDIGKIFEYKIDTESGLADYEENFKKEWLTHSQYGFTICMSQGFKRVAKMIAAHHARSDWGAIVDLNEKDLENYVYIMHHIDDLSAKFGKINVSML